MFHIAVEEMQQGEEAAYWEEGDDVVIILNSHLSTSEQIRAMRHLLVRRFGPMPVPQLALAV